MKSALRCSFYLAGGKKQYELYEFINVLIERVLPVLPYIHIGTLNISTYYTAMFLGFVVMVVLMVLPRRRAIYGLSIPKAVLYAFCVLVAGILGCKLLYVVENFKSVRQDGISFGGFSFYGAVLVVPLLVLLFRLPFRMSIGDAMDNAAVNILGMLGTIRIGCFLNGCCGGITGRIGAKIFTWPTQLMEAVCDFGILAWLLVSESMPGRPARGKLYPRFLVSYGIVRFIIEVLRDTPKDWLGLSHGQWFSIVAVIAGICWTILSKGGFNKNAKQ